MTNPVGGKRDRLIYENFAFMVEDSLRALGWMDPTNKLVTKPLEVLAEPEPPNVEVVPNKISIMAEDTLSEGTEMGSNYDNIRWNYYVEIFAENEAVGKHLAGDVRDILKGKISSIGRDIPYLQVLDVELATPVELFWCFIDEVESQRTRSWDSTIRQNWWTVACIVEDTYGNENDS